MVYVYIFEKGMGVPVKINHGDKRVLEEKRNLNTWPNSRYPSLPRLVCQPMLGDSSRPVVEVYRPQTFDCLYDMCDFDEVEDILTRSKGWVELRVEVERSTSRESSVP